MATENKLEEHVERKKASEDCVKRNETSEELEERLEKESIITFLQSFNRFATKKTIGQGALDLALLAANITKLTTVLERDKKDTVYYVLIVVISISIALQLVVGVLMGIIARMQLKSEEQRRLANIINNVITILVSVICVINIALSVIDVSTPFAKQTLAAG